MRNWRAWVFAALVVAIAAWIVQGSQTFQSCVSEHRQQYASQNPKERVANFIRSVGVRKDCVGEFIHKNGEAVTAAFTVVLAISTILLWRSTNGLYEAGERQIKLSRSVAAVQARNTRRQLAIAEAANERSHQIFVATQRPWVAVSFIEPVDSADFDGGGMMLAYEITIKNGGQTPALNVNWSCSAWLRYMGGTPQEMQAQFSRDLIAGRPLQAGNNIGHLLLPNTSLKTGALSQMYLFPDHASGGFQVIIVGCLDYRFAGQNTFHQTGFMFQLVRKRAEAANWNDFGAARTTFTANTTWRPDEVTFEPFPSSFFAT